MNACGYSIRAVQGQKLNLQPTSNVKAAQAATVQACWL
jgi:hypothetical protein